MFFLQTKIYDWYEPIMSAILSLITGGLFMFALIRMAVGFAMKEQRRLTNITNHLLIEQLRNQGVSEDKINEILNLK